MLDEGEPFGHLDDDAIASIRDGLDRILATDTFRGAAQLSSFLTFIVTSALEGRSAELKGYTIAVEALGRPPEFDPQADPIVRVEAGRLRKALGHYYATQGTADPVRISVPVGGYVPLFRFTAEPLDDDSGQSRHPAGLFAAETVAGHALTDPDDTPTPVLPSAVRRDRASSRRWQIGVAAALLVALTALASWYGQAFFSPDADATFSVETRQKGSGHLPVVVVAADRDGDRQLQDRSRYFTQVLVDAMARFDDLVTVRIEPVGAGSAEGADYVLEMSTTPSGVQTEGFARLRAVRDGRIVWSGPRVPLRGGADERTLGNLARSLAVTLAEPFGIIHLDSRQTATSPAMRCVFQAFDVRRGLAPQDHVAARECLEATLEQDGTFHSAWAQLALLTLDEYTLGLEPQRGPPLDRALKAALNAVRYAPSSARAQQVMMNVLLLRGQMQEALAAGRRALSLNPYDPDIMADLGARLIQADRAEEGLPLLQKAIALVDVRPSWYDFYAYLGSAVLGPAVLTSDRATVTPPVIYIDASFYALLGRALQAARTDDPIEMAGSIHQLVRLVPLFGLDPRLYLTILGFAPRVTDRIMTALGPAAVDLIKSR